MAGQRNRVWITRLTRGLLVSALAVGAVGYFVLGWFLSSPSDPVEADGDPGPVPVEHGVQSPRGSHPLDPVLEMASRSLRVHRARDRDYTATMVKRFRVGKRLGAPEVMQLKLRSRDRPTDPLPAEPCDLDPRPIDVYLGFTEPKSLAGREVIWREGFNEDKMIVHESGMLNVARVHLAPTSRLAMLGNRYPISDVGLERLLVKFLERGTRDRQLGDCEVAIRDNFEFEGRLCRRIEVTHPEKTTEIDGKKYEFDFYRVEIDVDMEHGLPIHYASYVWSEDEQGEPLLDEEFTYRELRLNCNLTDLDFDPDNPEYRYPSR